MNTEYEENKIQPKEYFAEIYIPSFGWKSIVSFLFYDLKEIKKEIAHFIFLGHDIRILCRTRGGNDEWEELEYITGRRVF